ncbi:MAG: ATP-binding protein [Gammaproteobacteria bacterium]|jgi:two-component system, OmpR family, sensor histidine kinase PhoQ
MNSLRSRLILAASVVLAVFIVIAGYTLDKAFYRTAQQNLRENLDNQMTFLLASAEVKNDNDVDMPTRLLETKFSLPSSGLYAIIVNQKGKVLWKSLSTVGVRIPAPHVLAAGKQTLKRVNIGSDQFYVKSYGINWFTQNSEVPLTFNVITDLQDFHQQILGYRKTLWGWLIALAVLLLFVQVAILVWGLRPLGRVIREINAIETGKQARITASYPREILRLTDNINDLIDFEHTQQTRYRNALADLAHSLKTPLAVLNGAVNDITDSAAREQLSEQIQRMDHIVAHQLQRAATAGGSPARQSIPLAPVINKICRALDKVYQAKHIRFDYTIAEDIGLRVDEGDLMEVLGNLLDNACKWCRQQVQIETRIEHTRARISIADDGPGIEQAQVDMILQRGGRIDQSKPGQGIGLSVVADIIEAYKGHITVSKSQLGGACFSFDLPAG